MFVRPLFPSEFQEKCVLFEIVCCVGTKMSFVVTCYGRNLLLSNFSYHTSGDSWSESQRRHVFWVCNSLLISCCFYFWSGFLVLQLISIWTSLAFKEIMSFVSPTDVMALTKPTEGKLAPLFAIFSCFCNAISHILLCSTLIFHL